MGTNAGEKRHRYEDRASDVACLLELPAEEPALKVLLRRFLAVLTELARRMR